MAEPRNPALERAIVESLRKDPDATEAFQVYGDWLQSKGHPRGELIALQCADGYDTDFLREHREELLGPLADLSDPALTLEWRCGFLRSADLYVDRALEDEGKDQGSATKALLTLPSARFLEELTLGCPSAHEDPAMARMDEAYAEGGPLPVLRRLAFHTDENEEMLSWTVVGNLAPLARLAPALRVLRIRAGSVTLPRSIEVPLEELVIETCGLTPENLSAIGRSSWPHLETLVLWFGEKRANLGLRNVEPLLDRKRFPKLRHLGLCNTELSDELVPALLAGTLLDRLRVLDLSKGTLSDRGGRAILEAADRFSHLDRLVVADCYLGETASAVERVAREVEIGSQRDSADTEGRRYVDVWE